MQYEDDANANANAIIVLSLQMPDKADSLHGVYNRLRNRVLHRNVELAVEYASAPSGLRRLFMVRENVSKDSLSGLLDRLPVVMRDSEYGLRLKNILMHISLSKATGLCRSIA